MLTQQQLRQLHHQQLARQGLSAGIFTSSGAGCLLQQPCDKLCMMQVNTDVQIVLEALGLADSKDAKKEEAALKDVSEVLKPHMGATWVTGNPNNKT